MVSRLVSLAFVFTVLLFPVMGLAAMIASAPTTSQAVTAQKSMCIAAGLGCGAGPMLLPALAQR